MDIILIMLRQITAVVFIFGLVWALPSVLTNNARAQKIYQFPNNTWAENIAIRRNGGLLVSLITTPEVWQLNPLTQTAELVYAFPYATSAMGIAEVEPEVFAVAIGNFSLMTGATVQGSWSVWSLSFKMSRGKGPAVKKITDIPSALFLNGATTLSRSRQTLLISDSTAGTVYNVNFATGAHRIVISDPLLAPNASARPRIGVNGIHYRDQYLFFTNTFQPPLLARIPVFSIDGSQRGPAEIIANKPDFPALALGDDFALDHEKNAWITTASNTLVKVSSSGKQTVIAGGEDSQVLKGCTSAAFGMAKGQDKMLYVTASGGLADPALGIEGGGVYSIDTSKL